MKEQMKVSGNTEMSNFAKMTSIDGYNQEYTTESYLSVHAIILRKDTSWMLHSVATVLHVSPIRGVISGRWVQAGLSLRRSS